ncbi:MAG: preprotein translocase subunit SecE [Elusimicrobiales bacterium]|jgi:preprotein translocase subunit SecE|nr:preprotein translocase subunit SecE [Elusimicrobiales bacterium]
MDKIINLPKNLVEFIKEAYAELKKVTWLSRQDVVRATAGVFMVVIFFALYVGLLDFLISKLVALFIGAR